MKIGFVTTDRSVTLRGELGGAAHYRMKIVHDALAKHTTHEVRIGVCVGLKEGALALLPFEIADDPESTDDAKVDHLWIPDVMIVQRYMNEGFDVATYRARAHGQVVINDIDDLFDAVPPTNGAWRATHPKIHPDNNIDHYRKALSASSGITCSTPEIAAWLGRYCHDVDIRVLRNAIDLDNWTPHAQQEPPALGWTGALSHRSSDVEQIRGLVPMVLREGAYAPKFVHVGALDDRLIHPVLGVDESQVWELPLAKIVDYRVMVQHIDVGLVPLRKCSFNDAKSCIKGMEYAASGIPFVASPSPEYAWLLTHHGIGRVAERPKQWLAHVRRLADPAVRAEEAALQRELVEPLDINRRWPEWETLYTSATP